MTECCLFLFCHVLRFYSFGSVCITYNTYIRAFDDNKKKPAVSENVNYFEFDFCFVQTDSNIL